MWPSVLWPSPSVRETRRALPEGIRHLSQSSWPGLTLCTLIKSFCSLGQRPETQITQCNLDRNEAGTTLTLETTPCLLQNALPASLETTETLTRLPVKTVWPDITLTRAWILSEMARVEGAVKQEWQRCATESRNPNFITSKISFSTNQPCRPTDSEPSKCAHMRLWIKTGTTDLTSLLAVLRVTRASMASGALVTKGKLGEDVWAS